MSNHWSEGEIIACQAVASENIILTIDTGPEGAACNILNTLPANFVPLPPDAAPTVIAINPLNGEPNIPLTSSVFATFTPQTACIVADTWTNVVTANIDPTDPSKGLKVISADLVEAGTFYLEELDWTGNPVKHVPTDLTVVDPPAGGTTIAVLRLGLDDPHPNSQYFLQSGYRLSRHHYRRAWRRVQRRLGPGDGHNLQLDLHHGRDLQCSGAAQRYHAGAD